MRHEPQLEAVFYFDGTRLYMTADALGKSAEFDTNATQVALNLPNRDEVFSLEDAR